MFTLPLHGIRPRYKLDCFDYKSDLLQAHSFFFDIHSSSLVLKLRPGLALSHANFAPSFVRHKDVTFSLFHLYGNLFVNNLNVLPTMCRLLHNYL